jgi:hypothetical protein
VLPVGWYMRTSATASHITLSLLPRSPGTQVWVVAASVRKVGYPHTANVGTTGANCRQPQVSRGMGDYLVMTLTIRPGTTIVRLMSRSGVNRAN